MSEQPTRTQREAQPNPPETGGRGRRLALGAGLATFAAGIAAAPSPAQAVVPAPSLSERVAAVRTLAQDNQAVTDDVLERNGLIKAQWVNWPNWGSGYVPWHNWHNWHNWGNGFWGNF